MTLTQLAPPYPIFTDKSGSPLDNGYLYFGTANLNPETNPITVYYDRGLTQPAAQPLRTSNGYVMRNGSPALIYANSEFSVTVRDKKKALVIYSPVGYGVIPSSVSMLLDNAAKDVTELLANTSFSYNTAVSGSIQVATGDILRTLADGFAYEVAASGATDQHVTTAGGVKLYVQAQNGVFHADAFGFVADGVTNCSPIMQKIVTAVRAAPAFNIGENAAPRGGYSIHFGVGLFVFASNVDLSGLNGVTFKGVGKESSYLVYTGATGNMFTLDQYLFNQWDGIGFAAGVVTTNSLGKLTVATTASGSRVVNLFQYVNNNGSDRFNSWTNCLVRGGFARIINVGGSVTHAENTFNTCQFFDCDYLVYCDNVQSVIWGFNDCDAEFISESCFYFIQGGNLNVRGGSWINPKDFLTLVGNSAQIGSANGNFSFNGVRWEMFQNIDPSTAPKIVRVVSDPSANISIIDCNGMSGSDAAKAIMTLRGGINMVVQSSRLSGIVTTVPVAGQLGYLKFRDCLDVPSVTRTVDNGSAYKVIFEGCGGVNGPILNEARVSDSSARVFSYPKNVLRLRDSSSIGSASTRSLSFACPANVIFTDAVMTIARGGGVSITVNVYTDAAKTNLIFTQNAGTSTAKQIWFPTIATAPLSSGFISGSLIYVDIVSGGNAGVVEMMLALEYLSDG